MLYRSALGTGGKLGLRLPVLLWYVLQGVGECGEQRGSWGGCSCGAGLEDKPVVRASSVSVCWMLWDAELSTGRGRSMRSCCVLLVQLFLLYHRLNPFHFVCCRGKKLTLRVVHSEQCLTGLLTSCRIQPFSCWRLKSNFLSCDVFSSIWPL